MNREKLEAIQEELGFCNCGDLEGNLRYIRDGLRWLSREHVQGDWDEWYAQWRADEDALFKSNEGSYFFCYWAESIGLTSHSGSIRNSQYLELKGEYLLSRLEEAFGE